MDIAFRTAFACHFFLLPGKFQFGRKPRFHLCSGRNSITTGLRKAIAKYPAPMLRIDSPGTGEKNLWICRYADCKRIASGLWRPVNTESVIASGVD